MDGVHGAVLNSELKWSHCFVQPLRKKKVLLSRSDIILESEFDSSGAEASFRIAAVKNRDCYTYCAVIKEQCGARLESLKNPNNSSYIGTYEVSHDDVKEKFHVVRLFDVLRTKEVPKQVRRSVEKLRRTSRIHPTDLVLGDELGGGAYSDVFEALQRVAFGEQYFWLPCAVKIYNTSLQKQLRGRPVDEFIQREVRSMKKCRPYPLIVEHFGNLETSTFKPFHGVEGGFAMKLESNITLRKMLQRDPFAFETIFVCVFTLAYSLSRMHKFRLQHRDLKPDNILFRNVHYSERLRERDSSGLIPILADLGLATNDLTAEYRGARLYQAPEMLAGGKSTTKADVYCLALIIAQIVMIPDEQWLSDHESSLDRELRIPTKESVNNSDCLVFGLLPGLKVALLRALNDDPGKRPSAQEFLRSLTSVDLFWASKDCARLTPYLFTAGAPWMPYSVFKRVISDALVVDRSESPARYIPEKFLNQYRSSLDRLRDARRKSPMRKRRTFMKATADTIKRYFPRMMFFCPLINRYRGAFTRDSGETGKIHSCLVAAADCLFVYIMINKFYLPTHDFLDSPGLNDTAARPDPPLAFPACYSPDL